MAADLASIVLLLNHLFSRACLIARTTASPIRRMRTSVEEGRGSL